MVDRPLALLVLAAGMGTRMKSAHPKVMHAIAGRPMVGHVLAAAAPLKPERTVVVVGPGMEVVAQAVAPARTVVQTERLGTGHAVMTARPQLDGFAGDLLVVYGDTPLLTADSLARLVAARQGGDTALAVLGFEAANPFGYGRLVRENGGDLVDIVEEKDATDVQRRLTLCNAGPMVIDAGRLPALLAGLNNANAKGEYYLTDLVRLARDKGWRSGVAIGGEDEVRGVNDRNQLAEAEAVLQRQLRRQVMAGGATLIDPDSVTLTWDTRLGQDVVVEPHVVFGAGVTVGNNARIRAFSHLDGARVEAGATVGPFARLRPGAVIGEGAQIGNFVEVKNAVFEAGAKASHLSYLGDARIGAGANVGAGTITCNYDGYLKHRTEIGAGAFIGSNTALVAPVTVGAGAIVGAGSTITEDVPDAALAVARGAQKTLAGAGERLRSRLKAAKAAKAKKD